MTFIKAGFKEGNFEEHKDYSGNWFFNDLELKKQNEN